MISDMTFGERLKLVRLAKCIVQKDMHADLQIPQGSLSLIEKGKFVPNTEVRTKLARYLGVNLYWLETGETSPFSNIKGFVGLNKCSTRTNENAAIDLLKLEKRPLPTIFNEQQKSLLIQQDLSCYIIFRLCEPYNLDSLFNKINATFLGTAEINESEFNSVINSLKDVDIVATLPLSGLYGKLMLYAEAPPLSDLDFLNTLFQYKKQLYFYNPPLQKQHGNELLLSKIESIIDSDPNFLIELNKFIKSYIKKRKS